MGFPDLWIPFVFGHWNALQEASRQKKGEPGVLTSFSLPVRHWAGSFPLPLPQLLEISNFFPGLPWWSSGEESARQCSGHEFDSWSTKVPHASGQLSPRAKTSEPATSCNYRSCNYKGSHHNEKFSHCNWRGAPTGHS